MPDINVTTHKLRSMIKKPLNLQTAIDSNLPHLRWLTGLYLAGLYICQKMDPIIADMTYYYACYYIYV